MSEAVHYRPLRLVGLGLLVLAVVIALAWDRGSIGLGQVTRPASEWLLARGNGWLSGFVGRLADDWLTLSMLTGLALLLLFSLAQAIGATGDGRALARGTTAGIVGLWLSGRPRALSRALAGRKPDATVARHFDYGREVLLGPLRFAQWAYPVVGFIGTVIGVSSAVQKLPNAVKGGQIEESALKVVLQDLHVAFDTTLVGLTASVLVSLMLYWLDGMWDRNEALRAAPAALVDEEAGAVATETAQ